MCHCNKRCAPDCSAAIRTLRGWRLVQPIRLSDRAAYGRLVADSTCQDRIAADKIRLLLEHSGGDSWSRSLAAVSVHEDQPTVDQMIGIGHSTPLHIGPQL